MTPKQITSLTIGAVILIVIAVLGRDLSLFFDLSGLALVLGGTLGGVFLAFPWSTLRELWEELRGLGRCRVMSPGELVRTFVELARLQRKSGARTLEMAAKRTGNEFLEMGVSMVVDEMHRDDIRERLEQEFDFFVSRREAQRSVLSLMGRLAPAFGLAGTMIGLIRMLNTISDPSAVAAGMSVALLTTFYGIMAANLLILPLERKLGEQSRAEAVQMTLITEGVMGLALEENGAAIQARLSSYRYAQPAQAKPMGLHLGRCLTGIKALAGSVSHDRG